MFEVLAHEGEEIVKQSGKSLDEIIRTNSIQFSLISLSILFLLTVISIVLRQKGQVLKYILFGGMVLVVLINTLYLVGSTIYLNHLSATLGPIHWHADFEIWHCGQEVNIKDPEGFSNKIGEAVTHEHNDKRMHFEGVLLNLHDASLGHFFMALGGNMDNQHLTIPTNEGILNLKDGDVCPDGNLAKMQVFVYQTQNDIYSQQKIADPQNYTISQYSNVPPGDCVIVEFGPNRDQTEHLCQSYMKAKEAGKIYGD